jgi:hypothetical protein
VWRRGVRRNKFAASQAVLQRQLLPLQPPCRAALLQARQLCLDVEALQLHALEQGQALTLRELRERQAVRQQACQLALQEFGQQMVQQARQACQACLDQLELQLQELHSQDTVTATSMGRRMSATSRLPGQGGGGGSQALDFTYAKIAARRSERRRLFSLVKLLELQMCDSLHALLMAAFGRALGLLQLAAGGYAGAEQRPLFSLELHLQQQQAGPAGPGAWQLELVPAIGDFFGTLSLSLRESADAVCAVPMLAANAQLQVCRGGGGKGERGSVAWRWGGGRARRAY